MVAQPRTPAHALTDEERAFLCTFPDDRERSPWMVGKDYHSLAIDVLKYPLRRHRADWYVASDLPILYPKPNGKIGQVAPDIMVAFVHNHQRDAFDIQTEGGFPPFVLEVVSQESRPRDRGARKKVWAYDLLGAQEYAIFDPRSKRRPTLAGYRRAPDGRWEDWPLDARGALRSAVLDLTLVQDGMLLRLEDAHGRRLPTAEEEVAAARAARETAERTLLAAQDEAARLRAEVARLRHERPD